MEVTIVSETAPQNKQKERSSNNFTTRDFPENATLNIFAYYRYGKPDVEEAKELSFDIKVDKTGHDTVFFPGVRSGDTHKNTDDRSLYIANPRGAREQFTVVIR